MAEMRTAQPTTKNKNHGIALLYFICFCCRSVRMQNVIEKPMEQVQRKNEILTENGIWIIQRGEKSPATSTAIITYETNQINSTFATKVAKFKQKLLVNIGENFSFGKIKIFGIYFWTLIYFNESRNIANA